MARKSVLLVSQMNKRCPNCKLTNFHDAANCARCQFNLIQVSSIDSTKQSFFKTKLFRRIVVCLVVIIFAVLGFYLSLLATSKSLTYDEKQTVRRAIQTLEEKGFSNDVFLLKNLAAFRGNDHWLNASVPKENAYAATNFPFGIITIYPDFYNYPIDDTERAAILLHEAQHMKGAEEKEAYEFVWKNRAKLGWTKDKYFNSIMWRNIRKQTKEIAPHLFVCSMNEYGDCTE